MFLSVTQWSDHCVFWQIFLWVFLFGLLPLSCVWLLFLLTKRKSGLAGGFAGRLACVCVFCLFCRDLPAFPDLLGPCTNEIFIAYAHVRTEPQCDIGHTRRKKIGLPPLRLPRLLTRQLCGSGCVCRPEFSIIRLKNNSIYLKPDESFVYIGGRVSIS